MNPFDLYIKRIESRFYFFVWLPLDLIAFYVSIIWVFSNKNQMLSRKRILSSFTLVVNLSFVISWASLQKIKQKRCECNSSREIFRVSLDFLFFAVPKYNCDKMWIPFLRLSQCGLHHRFLFTEGDDDNVIETCRRCFSCTSCAACNNPLILRSFLLMGLWQVKHKRLLLTT